MDSNDGELLVKNSDNVFASVALIADNAATSLLWFQDSLVKQSLFRYEHYLESLLIEPKKQYSCWPLFWWCVQDSTLLFLEQFVSVLSTLFITTSIFIYYYAMAPYLLQLTFSSSAINVHVFAIIRGW